MKAAVFPIFLLAAVSLGAAEFRSIALGDLDFEKSGEPLERALKHPVSRWSGPLPDVRAESEAYFQIEIPQEVGGIPQGEGRVVFARPQGGALEGVIDLQPGEEEARVTSFRFRIDVTKAEACEEEAFLKARRQHAARLAGRNAPGAAWFRHLAGGSDEPQAAQRFRRGLDGSFEVFSGGRAVSENLALDRDLILGTAADGETRMVLVKDIAGIMVQEIDWSARLPEGKVAVDPLAKFIPHDQHAAFSPSLPTLLALLDRLEREPVPVLASFSGRSAYRGLIDRYRRQMGLDLPDVTTRLLPVESVALTGGGAFFPTGTDVALLFETDKPERLFDMLAKAIRLRTGVESEKVEAEGSQWLSFTRPDRSVSSHLLRVGGLVAVTNSAAQAERLKSVASGESESLGETDEFRFFRHRYLLADPADAFVFLSDATIRRWGGPRMRIGVSRRNRALAALNELTSRGLSGREDGEDYAELLGGVKVVDGMARSERFGSAAFLTPVSELEIDEVTLPERDAYVRWRTGYERGWAQVFDPIALRISLDDETYAADLTVLPLTVGSDYRDLMAVAGDSEISPPGRTRPATSLMHLAMALDSSGPMFEEFNQDLSPMLPGLKIKPLSWVGDSIALDLHQSLFWESLGRTDSMGLNVIGRIPVSLRVASKSSLKLGLFLTALRGLAETSAPDAMKWKTRKHGERSYVVVSSEEEMGEDFRICYATMPKALLVALDEGILRAAIDRELAGAEDPEALTPGRSLVLDANPGFLTTHSLTLVDGDQEQFRRDLSWNALPVLNEWHLRFPGEDPIDFHEAHYGERIACPGGKGFRWNEEARTFESVAYGHPGAPRGDGKPIYFFHRFARLQAGIDFEDDGLRARLTAGPDRRRETAASGQPGGRRLAEAKDLVPLKTGRVLHYEGRDAEGERHTMRSSVVEVKPTDDGIRLVTEQVYEVGGESDHSFTTSLLADGERVLSWRSGESSGTYTEPALVMPAELREGAVIRTSCTWTTRREEDGKTITEDGKAETEIRVIGVEDIEVPAGTFKGCVVVECREEYLEGDWFDVSRSKLWYHPGTGLVKSEESGGGPTMSLIKIEEVE